MYLSVFFVFACVVCVYVYVHRYMYSVWCVFVCMRYLGMYKVCLHTWCICVCIWEVFWGVCAECVQYVFVCCTLMYVSGGVSVKEVLRLMVRGC